MMSQTVLLAAAVLFCGTCAAASIQCSVRGIKQECGYLGIQEAECLGRSCCWQPSESGPWCYAPEQGVGDTYVVEEVKEEGHSTTLILQLAAPTLPELGPDFGILQVDLEAQTPQRLHAKISPAGKQASPDAAQGSRRNTQRWEVPDWLLPRPPNEGCEPEARLYSLQVPQPGQPFGLSVMQQGYTDPTKEPPAHAVFDSAGTRLVFKEQYMEITAKLDPSTTLYGLGETINPSGSLALSRDGRSITLWNADVAAFNAGVNLYGSHPFILQVHQDGSSSGIFLLNSNGLDLELHPTLLTFRVIGGVLDFYFLLGPTPEAVIVQYHEVIGRPAMPPYWALGFHQCRWGYRTLSEVEEVVASYRAANIPLEAMWTDIDYMYSYRDFTFDQDRFNPGQFKAFVDRLHARGQRWVPITDCGIPHAPDDLAFTSGIAQGVFLTDVTGQPYLGQVWPGATHYPDFLAVNRTWTWWKQQLKRMWQQVPYDGMWIDMNEASNFCEGEVCQLPEPAAEDPRKSAGGWPWMQQFKRTVQAALQALRQWRGLAGHNTLRGPKHHRPPKLATNCELRCSQPSRSNKLAFPPYALNNLQQHEPLGSKTLPMTAKHVDGSLQYNTHNLYGLSEAAATQWALEGITGKRPFILSRSTFPGSGRYAAHWTGDNAATWEDLRWSVQGLLNSNMWGLAMAGADICGFQGDTTEELCARWIAAGAFYTFTRNHNTLDAVPQELYRWPTVAAAARKALSLRYSLLPYLYSCLYRAHTEGGTVARPLFFAFPEDAAARATSIEWMLGHNILVAPVLQPGIDQVDVYLPAATWYGLTDHQRYLGPATHTLSAPLTEGPPVLVRGGSIIPLQVPHNTTGAVRGSPITLMVALDHHGPQLQPPSASNPVAPTAPETQQAAGQAMAQGYHEPAAGTGVNASEAEADGGVDCSMLVRSLSWCRSCADGRAHRLHPAGGCEEGGAELLHRPGLILGCGMMYWDDGDSLQVPAEGSVTVLFSSMVQRNTQRGWIMMAAEGAAGLTAGGSSSACETPAGGGDALSNAAAATRAQAKRNRRGESSRQSSAATRLRRVLSGVAASSRTTDRGTGAGSLVGAIPDLHEVQVLGVWPPPVEQQAVAVWVDGQRLPDSQVMYNGGQQVLRVTGLQLQLGAVSRLEWGFGEGVQAVE